MSTRMYTNHQTLNDTQARFNTRPDGFSDSQTLNSGPATRFATRMDTAPDFDQHKSLPSQMHTIPDLKDMNKTNNFSAP